MEVGENGCSTLILLGWPPPWCAVSPLHLLPPGRLISFSRPFLQETGWSRQQMESQRATGCLSLLSHTLTTACESPPSCQPHHRILKVTAVKQEIKSRKAIFFGWSVFVINATRWNRINLWTIWAAIPWFQRNPIVGKCQFQLKKKTNFWCSPTWAITEVINVVIVWEPQQILCWALWPRVFACEPCKAFTPQHAHVLTSSPACPPVLPQRSIDILAPSWSIELRLQNTRGKSQLCCWKQALPWVPTAEARLDRLEASKAFRKFTRINGKWVRGTVDSPGTYQTLLLLDLSGLPRPLGRVAWMTW